MPHNTFGKKLNRDTGQRQALLKGLAGALIRSEAIETTQAKAEAARGLIEKLVTQAKRASVNDIRQLETVIIDRDLIYKLVHNIAPRFKDRAGGYLRLTKLGNRSGDNAQMVRMEFVAGIVTAAPASSTASKPKSPSAAKKSSSASKSQPAAVKKTASKSKKS